MTLLEKLALIRRQVEAVEKKPADDADPFTFAPADLVFDVVRDQLKRRKVLAFPSGVVELEPEQGKARVRIYVVFVDQENELDKLEVAWVGTGDNSAAAATNALKGAFLATFLIETVEPADVSRREARQNAVRRDGIASANHIRFRLRQPGRERGLYDEQLVELANKFLPAAAHIDSLENLPKRLVEPMHAKIMEHAKTPSQAATA